MSMAPPHASHPSLGHLVLLVFEAVLEVICVSLPGYIVARLGMFNAESQKFVANLNVALFTPCLVFTKLASQLTASKLPDLAVIPVIFLVQTLVSYVCARAVARLFRLPKRPRNFVVAMGVFGNSNSLPISLVISLSKTLNGLHWDRIPGDSDNEVAARGILYLLIFQQLGQLLRWSWGYNVLLAPPSKYGEDDESVESAEARLEQGHARYQDEAEEHDALLIRSAEDMDGSTAHVSTDDRSPVLQAQDGNRSPTDVEYDSGGQTPVTHRRYPSSVASKSPSHKLAKADPAPAVFPTPANGNHLSEPFSAGHLTAFPAMEPSAPVSECGEASDLPGHLHRGQAALRRRTVRFAKSGFEKLPNAVQQKTTKAARLTARFFLGLWSFMNPPLWAMLVAIVVASIPALQRLFFTPGTFIQNSVTSAIAQSGGVAVPLILVVLGANLARNTMPKEALERENDQLNKKLLIAALVSRMLLPIIVMAPLLALAAKYVPVSILDDPIFVVVCFLLVGAPSALQLAQICQVNGVYETVMAKLLFHSYVIWILPSTLILVMCALEAVEWANAS
ncbi:MAG: hypothetical protein M1826_005920 [Phylliscum demangeonii]|nr:MAG: hypothetical protein M1826_005920 [Phylliscum demangeonii]